MHVQLRENLKPWACSPNPPPFLERKGAKELYIVNVFKNGEGYVRIKKWHIQ